MQLDADVYYGFFTFYLGKGGYAVDDELYRYIIEEAANTSTALIHRRLQRLAQEQYFADYQLYLSAVAVEKIVRPKKKLRQNENNLGVSRVADSELARLMQCDKCSTTKTVEAVESGKATVDPEA